MVENRVAEADAGRPSEGDFQYAGAAVRSDYRSEGQRRRCPNWLAPTIEQCVYAVAC